ANGSMRTRGDVRRTDPRLHAPAVTGHNGFGYDGDSVRMASTVSAIGLSGWYRALPHRSRWGSVLYFTAAANIACVSKCMSHRSLYHLSTMATQKETSAPSAPSAVKRSL